MGKEAKQLAHLLKHLAGEGGVQIHGRLSTMIGLSKSRIDAFVAEAEATPDPDDGFRLQGDAATKAGKRAMSIPEQVKEMTRKLASIEAEVKSLRKAIGSSFPDMYADLHDAAETLAGLVEMLEDYAD